MNRPDESSKNSIIIYTTEDGLTKIDATFDGDTVWLLHADQRLNALISSDQRATLISVDSMAYSILMIPASPFVGAVGDLFGQAGAGLALLGVLTAASGAAVLAKRRS